MRPIEKRLDRLEKHTISSPHKHSTNWDFNRLSKEQAQQWRELEKKYPALRFDGTEKLSRSDFTPEDWQEAGELSCILFGI